MSALSLVIVMLVAITAAIAAVLTTVAVSSYIQSHRIRREPSLIDARQAIIDTLSGNDPSAGDALTRLSRLSERYIVNVILDLAPSFSGTSRSVLVPLGEQIGMLPRARKGVHRLRWPARLYSARVLTAFGVESDDLWTLFGDRSSEVRAQAAAWAVVAPSPQAIGHLIGLLNDDDGQCRFAAQDALIRIGRPGSDALICALDASDGEATRRLLRVAAATGDERFYLQASSLTTDPSPGTRALAVAVLARIGNPSAGPTLIRLLDDPSDDVVLAAAAGLAKLAFWPGAADIEGLLSDPSWSLRKQASLTLLAFGAPGTILLRANAPGVGPAAEMANRALQLKSLTTKADAA
jgi:hypothetical protein